MSTRKPPSPFDPPSSGLDELFLEDGGARFGTRKGHTPADASDDLAGAVAAVRTGPGQSRVDARLDILLPGGSMQSRVLAAATSIGRHNDNDIQLLDPEVSKAHLVIHRLRDEWVLEDLNSANGTLVNGAAQTHCGLVDGDVIRIGNSTLTFRLGSRPPVASSISTVNPPGQGSGPPVRSGRPLIRPAAVVHPAVPVVSRSPASPPAAMPSTPQVLSSFAQVRSGELAGMGRLDPYPREQTSVTLIPAGLAADGGGASVFAEESAEIDFHEAHRVDDDRVLRRDYERLRVAFELFTNVGLETDLEALGELILRKIRSVLPCDSAVIMLRDPTISEDLVSLASWSEQGRDVNIPRAIIERVLTNRTGLLTSDAQVDRDLRRSETIVGARIRSALCVPLVVRGEVVGVIHLSSASLAGAYEPKDLALLRAIAQPAALAVANARLRRKIEDEAATRAALSRFLSPALVEKAVRKELNFGTAGDKVLCTVLFSDIRGFTSISDGAAPEQVVSMLNEYFDAMVEVVFQYGGTLDKFLGDGLMAVWGTPVQAPDDAVRAVRAALEMRTILQSTVNAMRRGRGEAALAVGYGIATGRVVSGAMGARRRLDFTVIGDTVNLSSRLCGQATQGQLLVDDNTAHILRAAGIETTTLEPRKIKGFARPVPVFEVVSAPTTAPDISASLKG
jgi:adenylate cyclase